MLLYAYLVVCFASCMNGASCCHVPPCPVSVGVCTAALLTRVTAPCLWCPPAAGVRLRAESLLRQTGGRRDRGDETDADGDHLWCDKARPRSRSRCGGILANASKCTHTRVCRRELVCLAAQHTDEMRPSLSLAELISSVTFLPWFLFPQWFSHKLN